MLRACRLQIMAVTTHPIIFRDAPTLTGRFLLEGDVVRGPRVIDVAADRDDPDAGPQIDILSPPDPRPIS